MMKITLICGLSALMLVHALPQGEPAPPAPALAPALAHQAQPVEILKQDSEVNIDSYNFGFETSDGTSRQEQGEYKNDTDQQGLLVRGSYNYIAPDGQHISVSFIADKNGYQPQQHAGSDNKQPQGQSAPAQS